jgi:hypothetical protein
MQIRNVLKVYSLLRNFTDDETALLETLRSLTDSDREQLVESLAPVKVTKKAATTKTYERCAQCGNTRRHGFHNDATNDGYHEFQAAVAPAKKSSRATSLATAISGTAKPATPVVDGPMCTACGHPEDYEDHAQPSPHYHEFEAAGVKANTAAGGD